ncbi:MAG: L-2-amino-thiazoline-4-carboxylic acid hydrolase [Thermoguttaceae bacterium]|nr:L-2-amino-thiazoline-4-carboxylic acid hydrolase [Thermoguttaceae bacterium]MDW8037638.1 L-2-amino-thiazoline-4-carboxylic acid hydrolase [Thermoguttaceae bacterium]
MSRSLQLPDQLYEALQEAAVAAGCSMADWIARQLSCCPGAAQDHRPESVSTPPTEQLARLRQELRDSYANRAVIYWFIYDELRQLLGAEQAEALMSRAIYRRGLQKGQELYSQFAPADLAGLRTAFVGRSADQGQLFQPEVLRADPDALDIKFHACPLRETWVQMGLPDQEVATLCRIAAQVDYGTFQGAGFRFWADTWQPGGEGCCFLHIRPGPANPPEPVLE